MKNKRLYLLRHAKSSWEDFSISDFDRPLNKRGERDAPVMAERIKNRGINPDIIISSPAKRAKSTAKHFNKALNSKLIYSESIYDASTSQLRGLIEGLLGEYDTIMVVGHNPSLTMLSNSLCSHQIENIPTCGIVGLDLGAKGTSQEDNQLLLFDYPKNESE